MNDDVLNIEMNKDDEVKILRLRTNEGSFADIEVRSGPDEGVVLMIYQILEDKSRKAVKWVPNLQMI
jgi:hypothetical protein